VALEAPLGTRIALSVAVTSTLGAAMGVCFPVGMRLVPERHEAETPWFWGLNGIGSVLASSAAILIALETGLTTLMLCSAGCYALLVGAVIGMRR
jgi:hypothetical protein